MASHGFYPAVGGIEAMSLMLARGFVAQGHQVKIVTHSPGSQLDEWPFEVHRNSAGKNLLSLVKWCDVFFHNNICLQIAWPLLISRKPWIIAHHTWLSRADGSQGWQDRLKRFLLRFATNISVSQAIADQLSVKSVVIGNSYDDTLFRELPSVARDKSLVFLGRLVSDKGVDILLEALAELKRHDLQPELTIVGDGQEKAGLQNLAEDLGVTRQVNFVGRQSDEDLVRSLNSHRILIVPSRWNEPFGIVALEAIACGCVVVGSAGGGLRDAIGPCGRTFPNGDSQALSKVLSDLLSQPDEIKHLGNERDAHLSKHRQTCVTEAYLKVLENSRRSPFSR